ncbi:MAG: thioredoxin family protein [Anaerolineae bacterium]
MEIKVLGPGCPRCKRLEKIAQEAAEEAGVEATLTKVTQMDEIMEYPIVGTPGLVIDEELKVSGRLPRKKEVVAWLEEAAPVDD